APWTIRALLYLMGGHARLLRTTQFRVCPLLTATAAASTGLWSDATVGPTAATLDPLRYRLHCVPTGPQWPAVITTAAPALLPVSAVEQLPAFELIDSPPATGWLARSGLFPNTPPSVGAGGRARVTYTSGIERTKAALTSAG